MKSNFIELFLQETPYYRPSTTGFLFYIPIIIISGSTFLADKVDKDAAVINVKDYGAAGDGMTDDAPAIRAAIAALPANNFILYFPPGTYLQGDGTNPAYPLVNGKYSGPADIGDPIYFLLKDKSNFLVYGYRASVVAHPNNSCIINNRGFEFLKCANGVIAGLTYNGNIESRVPQGGDNSTYNLQNAFYASSSEHLTFIDCTAIGSVMDGFGAGWTWNPPISYIMLRSNYLTFERCKAQYSYRQGCSIVGGDYGKLLNCEFLDTGQIYGTSPMAGVDLEDPDSGGQNGWVIDGCKFINNQGVGPQTGLALSFGTKNTIVTNCTFIDNGIIVATPATGSGAHINHTIQNCLFDTEALSELYVSLNGGGVLFEDNIVRNSGTFIVNTNTFANGLSRRNVVRGNTFEWDIDIGSEPTAAGAYGTYLSKSRGIRFDSVDSVCDSNTFVNATGAALPVYCSANYIHSMCDNNLVGNVDLTGYCDYYIYATNSNQHSAIIKKGNVCDAPVYMIDDAGISTLNIDDFPSTSSGTVSSGFSGNTTLLSLCLGKSEWYKNQEGHITLEYRREIVRIDFLTSVISIRRTHGVNSNHVKFSEIYTDANGVMYINIVYNAASGYFNMQAQLKCLNTPDHRIVNAFKFINRTKTTDDSALTYYNPYRYGSYVPALPNTEQFTFSDGDMVLYNSTPLWRYNNKWYNANGTEVTS